MHDIGKYSSAFQRRLRDGRERVDHSTAGAYELFQRKQFPAAFSVAGHHAGLPDLGTRLDLSGSFWGRMNQAKRGQIEDYSAWKNEAESLPLTDTTPLQGFQAYFHTKMLFSALTDADWLDTEAYFQGQKPIAQKTELRDLLELLEEKISAFGEPKTEINLRRNRILGAAKAGGKERKGLFCMTVPTGGGKTFSSMAFALHHAVAQGLRRVIYVIPYCSILEQTQKVFEGIFGPENVTAHYSGAEYEKPEEGEEKQAFANENWEAPVILTTAVQFFESLFSNRPGKCRKLHNIAQSVIVFDEAQMLPIPFLRPCLAAVCELVKACGCSAVLCTATQPAVEGILQEYAPGMPIRELCPEREEMYQAFRRVNYVREGMLTDAEVIGRLRQRRQVLCVVNNRRQAQTLFRELAEEEGSFHLSTTMTAFDRRKTLDQIRSRLAQGEECRVISTSLIEAGVDVDFPEVYRALAGLDSIIQTGGRCNREGKRDRNKSLVHIFETETKAPAILEQNISAAVRSLKQCEQADAPETIREYFRFLYRLKGEEQLDAREIIKQASQLKFQTVAEAFRLIDGADYTIYIPEYGGAGLIRTLRAEGPNRALLRRLGQFGVSVYRQVFMKMEQSGALEMIAPNAGILLDMNLYSEETGLKLGDYEQNQGLFI